MGYDINGVFSRVHSWQQDRDNGIRILADRHDEEDDGFAAALNQVLLRSGAVPMGGDINMNDHAIIGLNNGTALSPSIRFINDPDTGLYHIAPDVLGFSTGGLERYRITNAGVAVTGTFSATGSISGPLTSTIALLGVDGTVALPAYSFTSDPDCGMYRISPNVIGFSVNGAKVLNVDANGLGVTGALASTGNANVGGALAVTGNATVGGTLGVTGALSALGGVSVNNTLMVSGPTPDLILDKYSGLADYSSITYRLSNGSLGVRVRGDNGAIAATISAAGSSFTSTLTALALLTASNGLTVTGAPLTVSLNSTPVVAPVTLTGTNPWVNFNSNGVAAPTLTNRSVGTKIVLNSTITAAVSDYAIGIEAGYIWQTAPGYKLYNNTGTSILTVVDGTTTMTARGGLASMLLTLTSQGASISIKGTGDSMALCASSQIYCMDSAGANYIPINTRQLSIPNDVNGYISLGQNTPGYTYSFLDWLGASGFLIRPNGGGAGAVLQCISGAVSVWTGTTALAANMYQANSMNPLLRVTSSRRYKKAIHEVDMAYARRMLDLHPVIYTSTSENDDPTQQHLGFIAEEVEKTGLTELVHYAFQEDQYERKYAMPEGEDDPLGRFDNVPKEGEKKRPDGVQYERIVVLQQALIKDLYQRLDAAGI